MLDYYIVNKVILTTEPGNEQIAFNEIKLAGIEYNFLKYIDSGVALIELNENFRAMTEAFSKVPPIFIRHVCPVNLSFEATDELPDLIESKFLDIIELLEKDKSFSVQTRIFSNAERDFRRFDINEKIAELLQNKGFILNIKEPCQVVSIIISKDTVYIGISKAADNLSSWGGGAQRFLREDNLISRAEFKLLEAIDLFELKLPEGGSALDLGAAPGGWTRVLRGLGLTVTAVDPAELDQRLKADDGVIHVKQLSENYLTPELKFDVIVNDMRMDAIESSKIMGSAAENLKTGGIAVMTLKLPSKGMQKKAYQAIGLLREWYDIIGARQLFHNRNEATVVMKRKGDA